MFACVFGSRYAGPLLHTLVVLCAMLCSWSLSQVNFLNSQLSWIKVLREASQIPPDRGLFAHYWAPAVARKPKPSRGVNTGPFMPHYDTQRCLCDPDQRSKVLHWSRSSPRCFVGSCSLTHWLIDTRSATWMWLIHLLAQACTWKLINAESIVLL